ncbi:MAG: hypothetical protein H6978_09350 [Gammaproteobacteria bacterium]|nr:hypothetical protein [Gammaproteobacteria bacterium]
MLNRRWLVAAAVAAILLAGISRAPMWLLADALAERQPLVRLHAHAWHGLGAVVSSMRNGATGHWGRCRWPATVTRGARAIALCRIVRLCSSIVRIDMDVTGNGVVLRDACFRGQSASTSMAAAD